MKSPVGALLAQVRAAPPVPFSSRHQIRLPWTHKTGAEQQMRAMGSVGTLFAIVDRLCTSTSAVEWRLYRTAAPGADPDDRTEVTRHAALDLWRKPNAFMTRQEFTEGFQQHLDLVGEGWWVIARHPRARAIPLEMWPVRPDRIEPVPDPVTFVSGYLYTGPDGQQIPLELDDVIQLRRPNPLDPYRGMGAVQTILADLEGVAAAASWNRNFFENSAEPGGIVEVERRLSDDEFEELSSRWREQHQGVANAHRVAILEQGKWVDRKYSMRDMQFAELRSVARDVIREAFGMPKFALGDVEDVNRATAEASKAWFAEQLTVPRLERIKQALNHDFLPLFGPAGQGVEFDYCNPVPLDRESDDRERTSKATAFQVLVDTGVDPDDAADVVGLPRMRVEIREPAPAPAPPPAALPAPAARLDVHHHALPAPTAEPVGMSALAAYDSRRALAQTTDDEDATLARVRDDHAAALDQLLTDWDTITEAQYAQAVEQVEAAIRDNDPARLARITVDADAGTALLRTALGSMATLAAARVADEAAAQGVPVTAPAVDEALRNRASVPRLVDFGAELIEIAAATAGLLANAVGAAAGREALRLLGPGARAGDVARRVGGFLRGLSPRGRRDALGGALHRATNLGRLATLDAAPPAIYTATEVNDRNRCGPCAQVDGREMSLAEAWSTYGRGGYFECEGGDRCRGTVTARWETTDA